MLYKSYTSLAWKSLLHGRDIIRQHALWKVGNGESIDPWNYHWGCVDIKWKDFTILSFSKVKDFICAHSLSWNLLQFLTLVYLIIYFGHAQMVEISLFTHAIISWLIMRLVLLCMAFLCFVEEDLVFTCYSKIT